MSNKKNSYIWIVYLVLVVLLVVMVISIIVSISENGEIPDIIKPPKPNQEELKVSFNGDSMQDGYSLGTLDSGVFFTVTGVSDYEVKVYAYTSVENDFEFSIGADKYTWGDLDGKDVTNGFMFNRMDNGFEIRHYGFNDIISDMYNGADVNVANLLDADVFRLNIMSETQSIDLYFRVNAEVLGITINPPWIIF